MSQYQSPYQQRAAYHNVTKDDVRRALNEKMIELQRIIEELAEVKRLRGILDIFFQGRVGTMTEREALAEFSRMLNEFATIVQNAIVELDQSRSELQTQLESARLALTESERARGLEHTELRSLYGDKQGLERQVHDLQVEFAEERRLLVESANVMQDLQRKWQTELANAQDMREKRDDLQRQLAASQKQLSVESRSLQDKVEAAEAESKRLTALFIPPEHDNILSSLHGYLEQLNEAEKKVTVKEVLLHSNHIDTLFYYSNNLSEVSAALRRYKEFDEKVKQGERVLGRDMLLGFSTVLGFYNLYKYLLQAPSDHDDSRFLHMLCDLSIPSWRVEAAASKVDAAAWLVKHLPPQVNLPGAPCSFIFYGKRYGNDYDREREQKERAAEDKEIAQAIIETERQSLLDFRKSLYVAVSAIAPLSPEEVERQEQRSQGQLLQEHALVAEPTPALASMPVIRVVGEVHQPELDKGVHIIEYEYRDPRYLSTPVKHKLAFDNNGNVLAEENEPDE